MAQPELIFEFVARYELEVVEAARIASGERVFVFPDAVAPLRADQEIPAGVTVRVAPAHGERWVGVFPPGEHRRGPRRPTIIGWPDEISFGVVNKGAASIVRSDDPLSNEVIPAYPWVTGFAVAAPQKLVVFTDMFDFYAYGPNGLVYGSDDFAGDYLTLRRIEGREAIMHGFFTGSIHEVAVDLETWRVRDLRQL